MKGGHFFSLDSCALVELSSVPTPPPSSASPTRPCKVTTTPCLSPYSDYFWHASYWWPFLFQLFFFFPFWEYILVVQINFSSLLGISYPRSLMTPIYMKPWSLGAGMGCGKQTLFGFAAFSSKLWGGCWAIKEGGWNFCYCCLCSYCVFSRRNFLNIWRFHLVTWFINRSWKNFNLGSF